MRFAHWLGRPRCLPIVSSTATALVAGGLVLLVWRLPHLDRAVLVSATCCDTSLILEPGWLRVTDLRARGSWLAESLSKWIPASTRCMERKEQGLPFM